MKRTELNRRRTEQFRKGEKEEKIESNDDGMSEKERRKKEIEQKKTERHVRIYFCPLNQTRIAKKYARKQKQQQQQRQLQQQQQQHQNQQQTN